jgi:hypothetical protein
VETPHSQRSILDFRSIYLDFIAVSPIHEQTMSIERLVRTHVTTGELTPPSELIQGGTSFSHKVNSSPRPELDAGTMPLTTVVKALGEYLVSTEDETRLKGDESHRY